ncbi:MAG: alanine racemase [Chromatiales bacterium]|jgi:alanine racemase|nr:alanine racemase [Chromatiales bacterium]
MTRPVQATIDVKALRANLQRVRQAAPDARVLAVIKANGYGHGMLRSAESLHEADGFGVASVEEGIVLRESGTAHPIVLLEGFFDPSELPDLARHRLSTVVHHERQVRLLERADLNRPLTVWLKIDTGMHRLGFAPSEAANIYRRLQACRSVAPRIRLMTHLARSDERGDPTVDGQLDLFQSAIEGLSGERSIANSAAILHVPRAHADWVRPGLMLYGASPFPDSTARQEGLRPVMSFLSRLIAINYLHRGDTVSYGGTWTCPEDMPIGVLAVGYGDGYPRLIKPDTPVWIRGRRAPIVGRVCMDMMCIDLRGIPEPEVGDEAELWGTRLPIEEIARSAGTIPYELLCGVAPRVPFTEI